MYKKYQTYLIAWAILLAAFNAVTFLARPILPDYVVNYDARFWIAWGFVTVAFAGNLACAWYAFRQDNLQKLFYNISLISVSYTGVILVLIAGIICMLIPDCPAWIAAIICLAVLAFNAIAVLKASAAAEAVSSVDDKIKTQTLFIKFLTADAESLLARATTPEAKEACKKVYEAVRYSDPMSNDALASIEGQITLKFDELSNAVTGKTENVSVLADELVVLIGDRNKKCKALK